MQTKKGEEGEMHLDITESSREAVNQEWSQGCRHNHWLNLNTGIMSSMVLLWCNILNGISLTFYNCQTTKVMGIFQEYFHLSQVEHFVQDDTVDGIEVSIVEYVQSRSSLEQHHNNCTALLERVSAVVYFVVRAPASSTKAKP